VRIPQPGSLCYSLGHVEDKAVLAGRMTMKRRGRLAQNLGIALGGILVALVGLEIGLRVYFTVFGGERQYLMYVASREEINAKEARVTGMPYLNYGLSTSYHDHNSLGYRGGEFSREKPEGTYRIVALGGSTTYGVFIDRAEDAYPAQLEGILREEYGYENVEVVNAGVQAYSSWETFINFSFRSLDLDPDLIIVYNAVNDVSMRLADPAFFDGLNSGRGIWQFEGDPLPASTLYRFVAIKLGWLADPRTADGFRRQPEGFSSCALTVSDGRYYCENFDMTPEELLAINTAVYFERNMRNLVAVAAQNDVEVMFSSWAYSPDRFDHPGGDFMTRSFMQAAVAEHNAILQQIAAEQGALYYDFAGELDEDHGWWVDGLHLNPRGAREQARQYAAFIHEQGLIE
jgi:lysophospholipase L1-like esterase